TMPATVAGSRAIITSSMMPLVVLGDLTWGGVETTTVLSILFHLLGLFCSHRRLGLSYGLYQRASCGANVFARAALYAAHGVAQLCSRLKVACSRVERSLHGHKVHGAYVCALAAVKAGCGDKGVRLLGSHKQYAVGCLIHIVFIICGGSAR